MPSTKPSAEHPPAARGALERAQQLLDSRPDPCDVVKWHHEALHVGDLSVLALALRK